MMTEKTWKADSILVATAEEMASVHSKKIDLLISQSGQWLVTPEGWTVHPKVCEHMESFFYATGTLFFLEKIPVRKFDNSFGPICDHTLEMVFEELHLRSLPENLGKSFRALKSAYDFGDRATLTEEILDCFALRDMAEIILSGRLVGCSAPVPVAVLAPLKSVDRDLLALLEKNSVPAEVKERSVLSWASPARRSAFWWYNY